MRSIPWRLVAAGMLTAVLLDLPFPLAGPLPVGRTIFGWFALVPLLAGLFRLQVDFAGKGVRWVLGWSFAAGWWTGALWFGANCYWVYDTMHLYGGMDKPMAVVCLLAFSVYLGFWFGVFALLLAVVRRAKPQRRFSWRVVAAVPVLWTAMEFAIARIPGFPWDQLGYSQVDNGLLTQVAPWAGVYGISFVLAAANGLMAASLLPGRLEGERRRSHFSFRHFCGTLGLLIAAVGTAGFWLKQPKPEMTEKAMLVQPNLSVTSDDVWVGPEWDRHIAQFAELGKANCQVHFLGLPMEGTPIGLDDCLGEPKPPELIVWPESPAPFRDADPAFRSAMAAIANEDKAPMIVGDIGMDMDAERKFRLYNSASVIDLEGQIAGRYDKIHLVPFGEYVPFRKVLFFIHQIATLSDMGTGSERKTFAIGGHRYGIFICYESVFGDEVRQFARNGAEVLVNISDDGWYGDTSAPWQHLNMARMRAIENRRWILRDTNNGVTASIDPYGTVRESVARHRVDALAAGYGFSSEMTFYTVHGDWLAWVCVVVAVGFTGWAARALLIG